jgi:hypothetical protein
MRWTAEITNDPRKDYELYVELLEDDVSQARLQWNDRGELELVFYGGKETAMPAEWLIGIVQRFKSETTPNRAR